MKFKNKKGYSLAEVVIATVIFAGIFTGLILLTTSSRTETSKSINYLRALQLAQEAIEIINSSPFEKVTDSNLSFLSGSLIDPATNKSVKILAGNNAKNTISEFNYPDDYTKCYYYRTIKINDLSSIPNNRFLKKITVGVYWNEGKIPNKLESTSGEPDRMRKLELSTIVFDEKAYY